jgi:hypothetical protein
MSDVVEAQEAWEQSALAMSYTKLHRLRLIRTVIAGLDPAIQLFEMAVLFKDGYAGQARV